MLAAIEDERRYGRELNALVEAAQQLFRTVTPELAQEQILNLIPRYPVYHHKFEQQIEGQHPATVLEAKLSHDLAYYRYFDQIIALAETVADLKKLIDDLKKLPNDTRQNGLEAYLAHLKHQYSQSTN